MIGAFSFSVRRWLPGSSPADARGNANNLTDKVQHTGSTVQRLGSN